VNSPWWIQTAWKVAKTFVHPNTQGLEGGGYKGKGY
jgi:hypothetical protein